MDRFLSTAAISTTLDLSRRYNSVYPAHELFAPYPWTDVTTNKWKIWDDLYQPFLARIIVRPTLTHDEEKFRADLLVTSQSTPYPTVLETRVEPVPLINPGDSCNATGTGTIGGFLRECPPNTEYLV